MTIDDGRYVDRIVSAVRAKARRKAARRAMFRGVRRMAAALLTFWLARNQGRALKVLWQAAYSTYRELEDYRDPTA